jgi:hypothetical protein
MVRRMMMALVVMVAAWTLWLGGQHAARTEETLAGCSATTESATGALLTQVGTCVAPIVMQGVLSGQTAVAIVDAALACVGSTVDAIIAYVQILIAGAGSDGGGPVEAGIVGGAPPPGYVVQARLQAVLDELYARKEKK